MYASLRTISSQFAVAVVVVAVAVVDVAVAALVAAVVAAVDRRSCHSLPYDKRS